MAEQRKRPKDYWEGYRDGSNVVWEEVAKMAAKGYSSREIQITMGGKRYEMERQVERELGIAPQKKDRDQPSEIDDKLPPGTSILIREPKPEKGFELFAALVQSGHSGYCVARTAPQFIREKYGLQGAGILWLSSADSDSAGFSPAALGISSDGTTVQDDTVNPTQMPMLFAKIMNFMEGTKENGVLFLECLEYLVANNSFPSILKFVERLLDGATKCGTVVVVSANPATMDPKEFSQLEREMRQVY